MSLDEEPMKEEDLNRTATSAFKRSSTVKIRNKNLYVNINLFFIV